jgi:hypothetical protein
VISFLAVNYRQLKNQPLLDGWCPIFLLKYISSTFFWHHKTTPSKTAIVVVMPRIFN